MYVVCITGASGVKIGLKLALTLKQLTGKKLILIISKWGWRVIKVEVERRLLDHVFKFIDVYYSEDELDVDVASGSTKFDAVIVCPCTMKTLACIVRGISHNLITRVVDVALKEGRKVIVVIRESPLSRVHVSNIKKASQLGVQVVPMMLTYYVRPQSVEDIENYIIGKVLDILNIEHNLYKRWSSREA